MEKDSTTVIWISASKKILIAFLAASLAIPIASASHYYPGTGSDGGSITGDTGFAVPEYDSPQEVLTQFVAPFILITMILHIGLYRALLFTLANDRPTREDLMIGREYRSDRKRLRKYSLVISLVITGMMVPTAFFRIINKYTAYLFGGAVYIFFAAIVLGFLLVLWKGFSGGDQGG